MKTPKRTCRDCLFFTSYSSADPDGRCGEGCGTYGTHTKGSEAACNAFMLSSAAKSARRKRKNRVKQLKHTIARLNRELALFLADGRYELIIDALQTLAEHGDADIKRACINALADFAK